MTSDAELRANLSRLFEQRRKSEQRVVVRGDSLDAAWADAEAALPEGTILYLTRDSDGTYQAEAERTYTHQVDGMWTGGFSHAAEGPTPVAALRALAARLRETT